MATRGYALGALGIAAILGVAGAVYGVLFYPEHVARTAVERAITTLPPGWTAHYGSLKYSVLKQQLVLTDVTAAHDATHASASQISLTGVEGGSEPGGQFKVREASIVGVAVHDGAGDTTVRSIDAVELAGDFAGIFQIFSKAEPAEAMLSLPHLLQAKHIGIADYRTTRGADNGGIARLVIDDLGHGVVGGLAIEEFHASASGTSVAVAKSTVAGADIEALQAVFDAASYPPGQKPTSDTRQLLRSLDMNSVDVSDAARQLHVDAAQLAGFRGRPFTAAPSSAGASDPRFLADVASALILDTGNLRGVKIGNVSTSGVVSLRNFEVSGYAGGKLAAAKVEGFDITAVQPQPVKAGIGSLELRGADLTRWLKLVVESGPAAAMARTNGTIEIPYAAASDLQLGAGSVTPARLASFSSESVYKDGQATSSKASIKDLEIPLDGMKLQPQQAAMIHALQLSRLVLNIEAASRWQPQEKRLLIDGFDLGLEGLGSFGMTASVAGFDPERFTAETMASALQALIFERLELRYKDASLVDRIIAMSAGQAGTTPELFRAKLIEQQEANTAQMQDVPEAAEASRQVVQFLRQPKTLTLTFAPEQPVGVAALTTTPPAQLVKILGLHVVAQ